MTMFMTLSKGQTLNSVFWTRSQHRLLYNGALIFFGSLVLALSAKIQIFVQPVNITLQSLAVLFLGMALGWRLASMTILLYLAEGAMGFPVFAGFQVGFAALLGPTGGYLLGFLPAAMLSGLLVEKGLGKTHLGAAISATVGMGVIFLFGVCGLSVYFGWHQAVMVGLVPFIFIAAIKLGLLALSIPLLWKSPS